MTSAKLLPLPCLAYAAASLVHFVHNAEFLADYPSMPAWLSRATVYGAWLGLSRATPPRAGVRNLYELRI
jgi:hypothetical protein